jgi:leucyl/phenylalanyl-tRNA--protein transferase
LEVWIEAEQVARLYVEQCGGLFAAESMYTRVPDMSKVAVVAAVRSLAAAGVGVFDVQFETAHLASMGAVEVSREEYLHRLDETVQTDVNLSQVDPRLS